MDFVYVKALRRLHKSHGVTGDRHTQTEKTAQQDPPGVHAAHGQPYRTLCPVFRHPFSQEPSPRQPPPPKKWLTGS